MRVISTIVRAKILLDPSVSGVVLCVLCRIMKYNQNSTLTSHRSLREARLTGERRQVDKERSENDNWAKVKFALHS